MSYRKMDFSEHVHELWGKVKEQPKIRLIAAALIIAGIVYVIFGGAYGKKYHEGVQRELRIAATLCENSLPYVAQNEAYLKLGNDFLKNVKVNGKLQKFEYIKHPKIVFYDTGFGKIGNRPAETDLFCSFKDPRTNQNYYFKYDTGKWVDKVRLRR